jgi:hypothetical protein
MRREFGVLVEKQLVIPIANRRQKLIELPGKVWVILIYCFEQLLQIPANAVFDVAMPIPDNDFAVPTVNTEQPEHQSNQKMPHNEIPIEKIKVRTPTVTCRGAPHVLPGQDSTTHELRDYHSVWISRPAMRSIAQTVLSIVPRTSWGNAEQVLQ